jgi:hypothetical protein
MGKGGNTKALPPRLSDISDSISQEDAASTLSKERAKKMEQSPGFYWDHDEEPHVLR